jgi:hypothetical protein
VGHNELVPSLIIPACLPLPCLLPPALLLLLLLQWLGRCTTRAYVAVAVPSTAAAAAATTNCWDRRLQGSGRIRYSCCCRGLGRRRNY